MDLANLGCLLQTRTPGLMDSKRAYAVLVPLVEQNGELCLLYEVRARTLRRQPGEVCFPGGLMEKGESPEDCALRETWEELAIPDRCVRLLGRLDFIAHRANFLMQPVLGVVDGSALDRMAPAPPRWRRSFSSPCPTCSERRPSSTPMSWFPPPRRTSPMRSSASQKITGGRTDGRMSPSTPGRGGLSGASPGGSPGI